MYAGIMGGTSLMKLRGYLGPVKGKLTFGPIILGILRQQHTRTTNVSDGNADHVGTLFFSGTGVPHTKNAEANASAMGGG